MISPTFHVELEGDRFALYRNATRLTSYTCLADACDVADEMETLHADLQRFLDGADEDKLELGGEA